MIRKNYYLTERQVESLDTEAERLEITFSELLRRIIDAHIRHNARTDAVDADSSDYADEK